MILIISSISSFRITKVISIPALATPLPCIFASIAPSIEDTDDIVANGAKTVLAKG